MSEEQAENDPRNVLGMGVDKDGFFCVKIHVSRGPREVLGFLEQAKDVAKQFYVEQFQKKQEKIVKPNGFLQGIKSRWH